MLFVLSFTIFLCFGLLRWHCVGAVLADQNENCEFWASVGECKKNPNYMLQSCQTSCKKMSEAEQIQQLPASFYDIEETDLQGRKFSFSMFRGKVVYIVNVASYCGYTQQNYEMLRRLQQYSEQGLVMLLAPCNSFGFQEPGDALAIESFASKSGFANDGTSRIILSKGEVNGDATRLSFQYLKHHGNKYHISWNFDGKFLVDRTGAVHVPQSESTLEQEIIALLAQSPPDL